MTLRSVRKFKWWIILLLVLICWGLFFLFFSRPPPEGKQAYFYPLKLSGYTSGNIPYFDLEIEGKTIAIAFDLGYEGGIALPLYFIEQLQEKSFIQSRVTYGLTGKTYRSSIYQLPDVVIGGLCLVSPKAEDQDPEFAQDIILGHKEEIPADQSHGRVGWCLFQGYNLFVDCKYSQVILCDSLETLKRQGYLVDSYVEVPLLLDRGFIEFYAMAGSERLRCILDSGATLNLLNKNLNSEEADHRILGPDNVDQYSVLNPENKSLMTFDVNDVFHTSIFKIGRDDFGPLTFNHIRSPLEFDAIIGMEFIRSHSIFIDFSNRKIFFFKV